MVTWLKQEKSQNSTPMYDWIEFFKEIKVVRLKCEQLSSGSSITRMNIILLDYRDPDTLAAAAVSSGAFIRPEGTSCLRHLKSFSKNISGFLLITLKILNLIHRNMDYLGYFLNDGLFVMSSRDGISFWYCTVFDKAEIVITSKTKISLIHQRSRRQETSG